MPTVMTWNMQGFSEAKAIRLRDLMREKQVDVALLQEVGGLQQANAGNHTTLMPGPESDGYRNNRVSLAIVSRSDPERSGFEPSETRGLLWIQVGGVLYGTWHENRGRGGLGLALHAVYQRLGGARPTVIGGDFNDQRSDPVEWGTPRTEDQGSNVSLTSAAYNWFYYEHWWWSTHRSGHNLDRVYLSRDFLLLQHWYTKVPESDHNPVFAYYKRRTEALGWSDYGRLPASELARRAAAWWRRL